jgi:eukaryotic-like serine/threonine-protein kinase
MQGGSNSAAGVCEGDILAGKYRVERVLGIGGMGVVVAAHHIQLDAKVALKFLLPDALDNSEAVARFAREARAAVKIKSEHVALVTDVGTLPNGAPYMVMEYLDGGDLAAWLKERGPLPIEQAVEFVLQACEAIAEAHALGIVHRDLKPANLFCIRRADGRLSIKVLDFGISKMTQFGGSGPGAVTHVSALMGSPLYMSPEQMRSAKDVNSRTDLWALGIVLFELLAGKPPFVAESLPELFHRVSGEPPPPLRGMRPEVPVDLEAVIRRCLEKDREQRYLNVAELAVALLPFAPKRGKASVERISGILQAAGLSASALALPPSPHSPGTQVSAGTMPAVGRTTGGRTTAGSSGRKRAAIWGGVGAAAVLVAVVSAGVLLKRPRPPREDPQVAVQSPPPGAAVAVRAPPPSAASETPAAPAAEPSVSASAASANPIARPAAQPARPSSGTPFGTKPTPPPPPTAHKLNCNPPYVIDSAGDRQYKRDCL